VIHDAQLQEPIPPMATAEKAQGIASPQQRDLMFWLQGRSVALRSVRALAIEFLSSFDTSVRVRLEGAGAHELSLTKAGKVDYVANHFLAVCTSQSTYSAYSVRMADDALQKFRTQHEAHVRARCAETSIGRTVFDSLDRAYRLKQFIAIEGQPGYGKSFGGKIWTELHLGQARHFRLSGITNRAGFFYTILKGLGFQNIDHSGAEKLERMLKQFLCASRLMLVIDEAQNLLPAKEFSKKRPELLDWIAGETFDEQLPCALLTWADFAARRAAVEDSTNWRATHLSRRLRYTPLDTPPTEEDLRAVAKVMLPEADDDDLDMIAGYAIGSPHYTQAVEDAITLARDISTTAGRKRVTFADINKAIEQCAVSDAANVRALETPANNARRRRNSKVEPMPQPLRTSSPATPHQHHGRVATPAGELTT
jgi:hypothetical protein